MTRLRPVLLAAMVAASSAGGCAGAHVEVTAKQSRYAISMSPVVRDSSGLLHDHRTLERVGAFHAGKTRMGFFYSALTILSSYDISEEVNDQVAAVGGEAADAGVVDSLTLGDRDALLLHIRRRALGERLAAIARAAAVAPVIVVTQGIPWRTAAVRIS